MKLKNNLDSCDLNVGPNLLTDKILLSLKDAIEQTFPMRKVSNGQANEIENPWMTKEILKEQRILGPDWVARTPGHHFFHNNWWQTWLKPRHKPSNVERGLF